jgi:hypothetical protein
MTHLSGACEIFDSRSHATFDKMRVTPSHLCPYKAIPCFDNNGCVALELPNPDAEMAFFAAITGHYNTGIITDHTSVDLKRSMLFTAGAKIGKFYLKTKLQASVQVMSINSKLDLVRCRC